MRRGYYFYYLLALSQTLTMLGYLQPWSERNGAALLEAYSDLTHNPTEMMAEMALIVVGCFIITLTAMVFTCYMAWKKDSRMLAPRVAAICASISLAGPLMYVQSLLQFDPSWSDLFRRLADMGTGWFLAVLFGAAAVLVGLYMIVREHPKGSTSPGTRRLGGVRSSVLIAILAIGSITTIIGYFQVWSSGDFFTAYGSTELSKSGTDEAPLMCLVPIAAGVALALAVLSQILIHRAGIALLHASRCGAAMGLSLTLLWGLVIGDFEMNYRGLSGEASLQPGWYVFLAGQAAMMVSLVIIRHGGWRAADKA